MSSFGVSPQLNLMVQSSPPADFENGMKDDMIRSLNENIRELKDENSRLLKLVAERELQIKRLKKRTAASNELDSDVTTHGMSQDQLTARVLQLSKRVRELTSEKEKEKTKCNQLQQTIVNLQTQVQQSTSSTSNNENSNSLAGDEKTIEELKSRLRVAEKLAADHRNDAQHLKNELRIAHKVLAAEVGESVNIIELLRAQSEGAATWKGRSQQIAALQHKVQELKLQLESNRLQNDSQVAANTSTTSIGGYRNGKQLQENNKRTKLLEQQVQCLESKLESVTIELEKQKSKFTTTKSRNTVLNEQIKCLQREQKTLLEKASHDDMLVSKLLRQLEQLQGIVKEQSSRTVTDETQSSARLVQLQNECQSLRNQVTQMNDVLSNKQQLIEQLQRDIDASRQSSAALTSGSVDGARQRPDSRAENRLQGPAANEADIFYSRIPIIAEPLKPVNSVKRPFSAAAITDQKLLTRSPPTSNNFCQTSPRFTTSSRAAVESPDSLDGAAEQAGTTLANGSRPNSRLATAMNRVVEVERDRLLELTKLQQTSLQKMDDELLKRDAQIRELTRSNVLLEKQASSTVSSASSSHQKPENGDMGELTATVAALRTENQSLQKALTRSVQRKEDDLRVYEDLIQQLKTLLAQVINGDGGISK